MIHQPNPVIPQLVKATWRVFLLHVLENFHSLLEEALFAQGLAFPEQCLVIVFILCQRLTKEISEGFAQRPLRDSPCQRFLQLVSSFGSSYGRQTY